MSVGNELSMEKRGKLRMVEEEDREGGKLEMVEKEGEIELNVFGQANFIEKF